jgi:hypothetical protein
VADKAGLPAGSVVVNRAELDHLQDRLFQVRCALEDAEQALADDASRSELITVLRNAVAAAGALDRLWITPEESR